MSRRRLSEQQNLAVELLASKGEQTYGEIAEKVGISERQLYTWRQTDDVFADAVVRRTMRNAAEYLPSIMESVPRHIIEEGNAAMFRTYMQSIGALTERVEIDTRGSSDKDVEDMRAEIERHRKRQ